MASAVICLATNQKFNFSKYVFDSMVKHLDTGNKFLMYPWFVQVFLNNQLEGMGNHNRIYVTPSHIKKVKVLQIPLIPITHLPLFIHPHHNLKGNISLRKQRGRSPSDPIENVADKTVNEELDDSLERAAPTATSLDAEQDKGAKTHGDTIAQTRSENNKVLDLETTMTNQAMKIDSLTRRVKKLEKKQRSRTYKLKRLYKVGLSARIESFDDDQEDQGRNNDEDMYSVNDLDGDEVIVKSKEKAKEVVDNKDIIDDIILAKYLIEIKSVKPKTTATTVTTASTTPKAKGLVIYDQEQAPTSTISSQQPSHIKAKDKGKAIMVEPEMPMKKKDQIRLDEELALKLQAKEEEEEERLAREKAQRLQEEEQEQLTDVEKAKLFMEFLKKRRKFFAAKRAKEKRNRPPTKAQQRSLICTYLKNIDGLKPRSLKNKSYAKIQELFDKEKKKINTFVDFKTNLVEENTRKS
uniref:Ribonuclease H-like domain, reverse transcriptase, RNA-dependent DNA polymerase n=1 Tax=Tanacetum cinerariifolium TaxID=118510 RepID=A0A699JAW0_TANCI|nr:ribonuclease H-like domain, reverse transcriptase, RNA-dependent DNA polymerase [Tanacetum cinerariifolium]